MIYMLQIFDNVSHIELMKFCENHNIILLSVSALIMSTNFLNILYLDRKKKLYDEYDHLFYLFCFLLQNITGSKVGISLSEHIDNRP